MALAKSPDERYPTTLELSEDIRRALNGESVLAKLPTPVEGKESAKVKSSRKSKTKLSTKGKKQTAKEKRASARFADSSYLGARPAVGSDNTLWLWIAIAVCSVLIVLALGYVVYALWISPA